MLANLLFFTFINQNKGQDNYEKMTRVTMIYMNSTVKPNCIIYFF